MYTRGRAFEIPTQVFSQGLDSCLRSIVRRITGRVGNSLLTTGYDNRGWLRLSSLLDDGQKGVEAVDYSK